MSSSQSSITGYKHDVFVSYAHVDNELIGGDTETAWVTILCGWLKNFVNKSVGGRIDLWRDPRLPGSEPLTPEIKDAVTHSATLLVLLSEGYLRSEWCRTELEMFLEAAGGQEPGRGRIFVAQCTEIERERWPAALRELPGFQFFERDAETGKVRTLGVPKPDLDDKLYTDRLFNLSSELADKLKRVNGAGGPSVEGPTCWVFLSEVTDDLVPLRTTVKHYLVEEGIGVVPEKWYPRTPSEFEKAMKRDLDRCELFVQMLGPYGSKKTDDLPQGFDGLQLKIARNATKSILRWRSPDLNLQAVTDTDQLAAVQESDVKAIRIEELKETIADHARTLGLHKHGQSNGAYVVVSADNVDRGLAEEVIAILGRHGLDYEVSENSIPSEFLLKVPSYCHGLIVIYGACHDAWVMSRLRECRTVKSRNESQSPIWALCEGPPPEKRRLLFKLSGMMEVDCRETLDERVLRPFIAAVKERCYQ